LAGWLAMEETIKKGVRLIVIFDDGSGVATRKEGNFLREDTEYLYLKIKSELHLIPKPRIIRIQTATNENGGLNE
jgi:hypothetical protein